MASVEERCASAEQLRARASWFESQGYQPLIVDMDKGQILLRHDETGKTIDLRLQPPPAPTRRKMKRSEVAIIVVAAFLTGAFVIGTFAYIIITAPPYEDTGAIARDVGPHLYNAATHYDEGLQAVNETRWDDAYVAFSAMSASIEKGYSALNRSASEPYYEKFTKMTNETLHLAMLAASAGLDCAEGRDGSAESCRVMADELGYDFAIQHAIWTLEQMKRLPAPKTSKDTWGKKSHVRIDKWENQGSETLDVCVGTGVTGRAWDVTCWRMDAKDKNGFFEQYEVLCYEKMEWLAVSIHTVDGMLINAVEFGGDFCYGKQHAYTVLVTSSYRIDVQLLY